jgi:hypothetical protein
MRSLQGTTSKCCLIDDVRSVVVLAVKGTIPRGGCPCHGEGVMLRMAVYLAGVALVWRWYRLAAWRDAPKDKWVRLAREGGYPLEPLK